MLRISEIKPEHIRENIDIEALFPFNSFRPYQREIINEVKEEFETGTEVAIIEGPTGFGKSPVNTTLGKYFKSTFYTTPQIKLVNQLAEDFGPSELAIDGGEGPIIPILGRANYICRSSHKKSDRCPLRDDRDHSCSNDPNCTYWRQKSAAISADIAILTFAMLITNSYIAEVSNFKKRNLLIVDECHSLEGQTASMFAGFTLSPYSFPKNMRRNLWGQIYVDMPKSQKLDDYIEFLQKVKSTCSTAVVYSNSKRDAEILNRTWRKIDYMLEEVFEGRKWIVNKIRTKKYEFPGYPRQFKPIYVDNFLRRKVWSQANKIILSSATIPFRDNIQKWLYRLGLGKKKFSFHSVPMQFPLKNRPIITNCIGGKMTHGCEDESWDENLETIKNIILRHKYERGVIHAQSYKRAKRLAHDLRNFNIFLHNKDNITEGVIQDWINSKKNVLISPAVKEGVDLKDDLCRYQILLKVPYPSIGDRRVKYLLNEKKQWKWYYNECAKDIIQSYGRAVRSENDYAQFYIIDGSFRDIYKRVRFPSYFLEAINYGKRLE